MPAPEEPPVGRKRAGMHRSQHKMPAVGNIGSLAPRIASPQKEHNRCGFFIQHTDDSIRKDLPSHIAMGIGLTRHNSQTGIQQQDPLFCPRNQGSVVWNIASEIRLQFLVNVYK